MNALQVLLQPRCLLVVAGEAYSSLMHSIDSSQQDVISEHCCNRDLAGVAIGQQVQRAERRFSVVMVTKQNARVLI